MLIVENVTMRFGGLVALNKISLQIKEKEIVGIIGPNGSGKTTLFNCVSGVYSPGSGRIIYRDHDITRLGPEKIFRLGIGRTFQNIRIFQDMTVLENVMVGALFGRNRNITMNEAREKALYWLEFVGLKNKKDMLAKDLPLAQKKLIEIARVLAANPELVLFDEPLAGLNPEELSFAVKTIKRVRDELGITVVWVEHILRALMKAVDRVIVLHHGEKIAEGSPQEIVNSPRVIEVYLGKKRA
ncbi:MAG: ABC transporter ATP-binding protein [candidate division WOR-3 bacterium]